MYLYFAIDRPCILEKGSLDLKPFLECPPTSGVLALATVIFRCLGNQSKAESSLRQLLSTCLPCALHSNAIDEVLYGRAGFLSCLLFVRKHVGADLPGVSELVPAMRKVFELIMESGKRSSHAKPPNTGYEISAIKCS